MKASAKRGLVLLAPALLGVASGAFGGALAWHYKGGSVEQPPTVVRERVIERIAPMVPAVIESQDGPAGMRAPATREAALDPALDGNAADFDPPPQMDLEEAKEQLEKRHADLFAKHQEEGRDEEWAGESEGLIADDLDSIDGLQVSNVRVDCRTITCRVDMTWPDYRTAVEQYSKLLHHHYRAGCARSILLPEPEDPEAEYAASAVLECEEGRMEGG